MSDQELHDFLIISIHAPPRGATLCRRMLRIFSAFQFTPLREGRHYTVLDRSALTIFQFTPLREGRRDTTIGKATGLISIHAPPRGATIFSAYNDSNLSISIHAPPRGATTNRCSSFPNSLISIHAPPRGATPSNSARNRAKIFQFTPLREGRRSTFRRRGNRDYFNSRPSARGDAACEGVPHFSGISIHAPPRGATLGVPLLCMTQFISIHAPPRGATISTSTSRKSTFPFQFTPLREGRHCDCAPCCAILISIHAPPRGATRNGKAAASTMADFNSRPSARGDLSGALFLYLPLFQFTPLREGRPRPTSVSRETPRFQFTPLREGRLEITESVSVAHSHFNSRPSARGDSAIDLTPEKGFISIHAPPRGATFPFRGRFRPFAFQFTPLREGRPVHGREKGTGTFISIHAPPRGATI